jgi:hypothetical protein
MYASEMEASILALFLHFFEGTLDISRLDSTNGPAQAPPSMPHTGGAKSNAASKERSQVERSSPIYSATQVPLVPSHESWSEITPWHKAGGRNSLTLPA